MHQQLKNRALGGLAEFVAHRPRLVLFVAGLLVLFSLLVTLMPVPVPGLKKPLGPLHFQSNRNDLISRQLDWNKKFIHWQENFSGTSDLVIVADSGDPADPQHATKARAVEALIDDLGPVLSQTPWVASAVWGFDKLKVSAKALRLEELDETKPTDEFRDRLARVQGAPLLLASTSPEMFIGNIVRQMHQQGQATSEDQAIAGLKNFTTVLAAFSQSLENHTDRPTDIGRIIVSGEEQGGLWQYLISDNNRLYFIRVTPQPDKDQINALAPAIAAVRRTIQEISARHPGVDVGLTGIDVVEADETDAATWDGTLTSIFSAVFITTIMILGYHSFRMPLMHMLALLVAIAWTFGFTTLAVGHLQVISVVFVPLLLGLGIAYGIYLTSRFELIRHDHPDDEAGYLAAMCDTYCIMGPGILTGCLTTAAAFMMTLFTSFTGVAEMGLIAGVGVLLCLISMFTVFPALVRIIKPGHEHIVPVEERYVQFYKSRWFMPFVRWPRLTLMVGLLLTGASLFSLWGMEFDYNLLKLQPRGMASVEWERRIVEDAGESIWFGVSIVKDMNAARELAAQYRAVNQNNKPLHPTIGVIRGVGLLIPDDEQRKIALLDKVKPAIDAAVRQRQTAPVPEIGLLPQMLILRQAFDAQTKGQDIPAGVQPHLDHLCQAMDRLIKAISALSPDQLRQRSARLRQEFIQWRDSSEQMVRQALDTSPLGLADLPPELLAPYRGADGTLSLEIFPKLPDPQHSKVRDVLDPEFLPHFISDLRAVDKNVTGVSVQIYESGVLIRDSYLFAGLLGMVVVFLMLVIDFQSVRDALLAMLPVVVGFAITFGIMRLAGMTINAANIIVLPLMFGIGVDSGVHLIYRNRMDPTGRPPGLTQGTGIGVILVNLTAIIGFGVLAVPYIPLLHVGVRHRGIQSLGFVLTCGMAMTLLACLTVMPAWLELRRRKRVGAKPASF